MEVSLSMKQNNKDRWLYYSQSYLEIAKLACMELLKSKHGKRGLKSQWKYQIGDLIIPIFYNTKHGIEIFIKTISLITSDKKEKGHDIHKLFENLIQEFKKVKLQPFEDSEGNKITQEMIDNFQNNINKILELVDEFYTVGLLKSKIKGDFLILDTKNDIFRYPDNKASIRINWEEVLPKFTLKDIKELKVKIDEIYRLFNEIGFIITILVKK